MDTAPTSFADRLTAMVDWIEAHLDAPLTLAAIAERAGLSPYHFSRVFSARMGRSVMAHVRARRLIRAARRLVDDPDLKLVDLAFDCGFESQEAFTRAFVRIFGTSPGRFRRGFAVTPMEGQYPMTAATHAAAVVQLPDLKTMEAFTVAGPSRRFDQADKSDIPQLWTRLIGALPFEGQVASWNTYGVVWGFDREEGSFAYMAGVGVEPDATPPEGFELKAIPAATYLVFRITLDGSAVHPQIKAAMERIWGELVPASGLTLAESPDFELYDGEFEPTTPGVTLDFHVPVKR
ncbi:helix-turn-helix domain-containing protein [Brevundimonas staleyi]|uniref:Helix-turn-helix domain-containing protein n=1 Tax=Brevundimonas staleyi TaxID=74326 RepID=A0ABW0FL66_9CAUL